MTTLGRRREKRGVFTATIEYSYIGEVGGEYQDVSGKGLTTNLSRRGLGFYTYLPFCKGQALTVLGRNISKRPIPATVRWCFKISDHIFKVGLMFN